MSIDFSWSHIVLFLVVALVVVGPQDLPKLMRKVGQWVAKARSMADQFRSSFDEMARQSELDELRKEIESLRNAKPLAETEQALNDALKVPEIHLDKPAAAPPEPAAEPSAVEPPVVPFATEEAPVRPIAGPVAPPQTTPEPPAATPDTAEAAPDPAIPDEPVHEPELPFEGGYTPPKP